MSRWQSEKSCRPSCGTSLSWSAGGYLYTRASIIKLSAVSQFGARSDRTHILPEKQKHAWICAHTGRHWGIRGPLHIKCQHSSSYYVDRNGYTIGGARMTVSVHILRCNLQYRLEKWAMHSCQACITSGKKTQILSHPGKKVSRVWASTSEGLCRCLLLHFASFQTLCSLSHRVWRCARPIFLSSVLFTFCNFLQSALLKLRFFRWK